MRRIIVHAAVMAIWMMSSVAAQDPEHEGEEFWVVMSDWIELLDNPTQPPASFLKMTYDEPGCDARGPSLAERDDLSGAAIGYRCNGCGAGMGGDVDITVLEWDYDVGGFGHHTYYKDRDGGVYNTADELKATCVQDTSYIYSCTPPPFSVIYKENSQLHCQWLEPRDPTIPVPPDPKSFKAMFVGDSITQGMEGDYTWRYRLWQWLVDADMDIELVGPYEGTKPPEPVEHAKPSRPSLDGETDPTGVVTGGKYAKEVPDDFPDKHYAMWGRQAAQLSLGWAVADAGPHWLLMMIGFNDLGWFVSSPEGTLDSVKYAIRDARNVNPYIKILLGNVVQRTLLVGVNEELPDKTTKYNNLLKDAIADWSTDDSPVKLVDVAANYDCAPDGCPAGYDGLHPNAHGELQIAQAFSKVLHEEFDIGDGPITNTNAQQQVVLPPDNFNVDAVPEGIKAWWEPVFGARGYDIRARRGAGGAWAEYSSWPYSARWETWVLDGEEWAFQVRTSMGDGDEYKSPWTQIVPVIAHPETVGGPTNIQAESTGTGMLVKWDKVDVDGFDRYGVIIYDQAGGFAETYGTRDEEIVINNLPKGHVYNTAVQTWNDVGGGFPAGGPVVTI